MCTTCGCGGGETGAKLHDLVTGERTHVHAVLDPAPGHHGHGHSHGHGHHHQNIETIHLHEYLDYNLALQRN